MKFHLKSIVAGFALIFGFGPMTQALDFYATNYVDNSIYGINIDGTYNLIGASGVNTTVLQDIAVDPLSQSTFLLASNFNTNKPELYSTTIGASSVSSQFIGQVSPGVIVEGGLAFSSFQGTNTLYASGVGTGIVAPKLYSINTTTGLGTVVSTFFDTALIHEVQSIFNAPDGRLWGMQTITNYNTGAETMGLFRFATNGSVDQTVNLSGFEIAGVGGATVKNGVTYFITGSKYVSHSLFGTLERFPSSCSDTRRGGCSFCRLSNRIDRGSFRTVSRVLQLFSPWLF